MTKVWEMARAESTRRVLPLALAVFLTPSIHPWCEPTRRRGGFRPAIVLLQDSDVSLPKRYCVSQCVDKTGRVAYAHIIKHSSGGVPKCDSWQASCRSHKPPPLLWLPEGNF